MLRVGAMLSGLVVAAWLAILLTVDVDSDANAATAYVDFTVYAIAALALIWLATVVIRLVGRARRRGRDIANLS